MTPEQKYPLHREPDIRDRIPRMLPEDFRTPYSHTEVIDNLMGFPGQINTSFDELYERIKTYIFSPQFLKRRIALVAFLGPPGSGKTEAGAEFLEKLLRDRDLDWLLGRRILEPEEEMTILTLQFGESIKASKKERLVGKGRRFGELSDEEYNNVSDFIYELIEGTAQGSERFKGKLPRIESKLKLITLQVPAVTATTIEEDGQEKVMGTNRGYTTLKRLAQIPELSEGLFAVGMVPSSSLRAKALNLRVILEGVTDPEQIYQVFQELGIVAFAEDIQQLSYLPTSWGGTSAFTQSRLGIENLLPKVCPTFYRALKRARKLGQEEEVITQALGECLLPQIISSAGVSKENTLVALNHDREFTYFLDPMQRHLSLVRRLYGEL